MLCPLLVKSNLVVLFKKNHKLILSTFHVKLGNY